jgi:hypothetical protein
LFLAGHSLGTISRELNVPLSTVSWHLIHPLREIDERRWLKVRKQLLRFARDSKRASAEELAISVLVRCKSDE